MSQKQPSTEYGRIKTIVDKWLKTRHYPYGVTLRRVAREVLNLEPHQIDDGTGSRISLALYELDYKRGLKKRFFYCPCPHQKDVNNAKPE